MLNPCAREPKARTGRFLRGTLISGHGLFPSCKDQQEAVDGEYPLEGVFQGWLGLKTSGSLLLAGRLHQLNTSITVGLSVHFPLFLHDDMALRKNVDFDLLIKIY